MLRARAVRRPVVVTVLAACALLTACSPDPAGFVPVTTTPASTRYAQIDAVRTALGGEWSVPAEFPHTSCTPPDGEPDTGMQLVVTTTSEATRDPRGVTAAGGLAADALAALGATVPPLTDDADQVVVTGVDDASGATTTVRIDAAHAEITHTTRCNDEIEPA